MFPLQLYFQHVFLNKWITFCLCMYSSSIWCIFNPLALFISVTQSSSKFLQVSGTQVGERWRLLIHSLGERLRRESFWERKIFNSLALIKLRLASVSDQTATNPPQAQIPSKPGWAGSPAHTTTFSGWLWEFYTSQRLSFPCLEGFSPL